MIGYKLTSEQKNLLVGQEFAPNQYFNPVQDINGDWFIFEGEVNGHVTVQEFFWVKELTPSEFVPPINNEA
jgi:hypothetical protein